MANVSTPARHTGKERLKGLVLAGGKGSRLRPLTATGAKQLVPVANRPIVFYALEQMVAAGITDIGIITGDTASQVEQTLGDGSAFGARFTYIHQDAPLGLAHAVKTARNFLGEDAFCMYLGDNFLKQGIAPYTERFCANGANAQILLTHVADPSAVGVAILDEAGHITRLVEKPSQPVSDLAVIGVYFFSPEIHDIIDHLSPSARGELEITDAIQGLVEAGYVVDASIVDDTWVDTGKKDDMLEANRIVLGAIRRSIEGDVDRGSTVTGEVAVAAGARIINSIVRGPAVIGAGARIENAFVGPFTSIGEQCQIIDCEIEHSIVMCNSIVRNISLRISDSLIGKEVIVERREELPHTVKLLLGDHAQVGLA